MARACINVMRVAGNWSKSLPGYRAKAHEWCAAALPSRHKDVSVVFADDAFVQGLNRTYRGKNKPTNVLSFAGAGDELGDIVLAYETIRTEAKVQRTSFARHTAHLIVHGCLHLRGHDHERERDAMRMEMQEIRILKRFGFPNPYEVAHD